MTKVEDYDDVSVQVVERSRVHESLVDILLDTTDVKDIVEGCDGCWDSPEPQVYKRAVCAQGLRFIAIEDRMENAMGVATLLFKHLRPEDEEVVLFGRRVRRVEMLVESVRNQLIQATGICGETDRYDRAVTQWVVGVERQSAKTEVKQTDGEAMARLKARTMRRQVFEEGW